MSNLDHFNSFGLYTELPKDELIKRIQQCEDVIEKQDAIIRRLNADIRKDKNGYLYIAQFEIEKERHIQNE